MAQSLKAPQVSLDLSELDIRERRSIRNPNPSALDIPADALRTSELDIKERRSIRNTNPE